MKWFRSNIGRGVRLALLALAVQFVVSFGHTLWLAAQAAPAVKPAAAQSDLSGGNAAAGQATPQSRGNRDPDRQPGDNCAICAVVAMAGTVLFATPPLLRLPEAVEFLYRTTDAEFVHLKSAGMASQPRAHPAS